MALLFLIPGRAITCGTSGLISGIIMLMTFGHAYEGASQMIEILALLDQKTRGNLTAEERAMLEQVLYELRMRFVEASGKRIVEP